MRKYLIVLILAFSLENLWAVETYPLSIRKFEKDKSGYKLLSAQNFRYDADTNLVEKIEHQIVNFWDEDEGDYVERKYVTKHVVSEYNEQGCYHEVELLRDELHRHYLDEDDLAELDTSFIRVEYFFTYKDNGDSQTICLIENDSSVSNFDAYCRLLSSKTYDRETGNLTKDEAVTWSPDSLQKHTVINEYMQGSTEIANTYHEYEEFDSRGNTLRYETDDERLVSRYWYSAKGKFRKAYAQHYEQKNGKWKRVSYQWVHPRYEHGFTKSTGLRVGASISSHDKCNSNGDVIKTHEIVSLACLIPFTNRYFFEYEYLTPSSH